MRNKVAVTFDLNSKQLITKSKLLFLPDYTVEHKNRICIPDIPLSQIRDERRKCISCASKLAYTSRSIDRKSVV